MHENHFVHRDLKPENVLYLNESPDSPLKLIDFGTSCPCLPNQKLTDVTGTVYYQSP